ncbi:YciI family protein [Phenylobacterium sp.]|jgi:uncharacterized protein YciI|uniref:YciI family protein n=1 Tax=Phenylobacterium sp. TaxID=1871053 RepID=UPI0037C522F0
MAANDHPPTVERYDSPLYLIVCRDGPGSAVTRAEELDGHLRHVEVNWRRYVLAGPLRDPGAQPLIGSYFLVRAVDEADARALMSGDPYVSSGMYATMEVLEATASIGLYLGGKIWASADAIRDKAAG